MLTSWSVKELVKEEYGTVVGNNLFRFILVRKSEESLYIFILTCFLCLHALGFLFTSSFFRGYHGLHSGCKRIL